MKTLTFDSRAFCQRHCQLVDSIDSFWVWEKNARTHQYRFHVCTLDDPGQPSVVAGLRADDASALLHILDHALKVVHAIHQCRQYLGAGRSVREQLSRFLYIFSEPNYVERAQVMLQKICTLLEPLEIGERRPVFRRQVLGIVA